LVNQLWMWDRSGSRRLAGSAPLANFGHLVRRGRTESPKIHTESRLDRTAQKVDDLLGRGPGTEYLGHAELLELRHIVGRDRAAEHDQHVIDTLLGEQL